MTKDDIEYKLNSLVRKVESGRYDKSQIADIICDLTDEIADAISDAHENGYAQGCEERAVETHD